MRLRIGFLVGLLVLSCMSCGWATSVTALKTVQPSLAPETALSESLAGSLELVHWRLAQQTVLRLLTPATLRRTSRQTEIPVHYPGMPMEPVPDTGY